MVISMHVNTHTRLGSLAPLRYIMLVSRVAAQAHAVMMVQHALLFIRLSNLNRAKNGAMACYMGCDAQMPALVRAVPEHFTATVLQRPL